MLETGAAYCNVCKVEFLYKDSGYMPFCPHCQKRAVLKRKAAPHIKQCGHCGCAPCACHELYEENNDENTW